MRGEGNCGAREEKRRKLYGGGCGGERNDRIHTLQKKVGEKRVPSAGGLFDEFFSVNSLHALISIRASHSALCVARALCSAALPRNFPALFQTNLSGTPYTPGMA